MSKSGAFSKHEPSSRPNVITPRAPSVSLHQIVPRFPNRLGRRVVRADLRLERAPAQLAPAVHETHRHHRVFSRGVREERGRSDVVDGTVAGLPGPGRLRRGKTLEREGRRRRRLTRGRRVAKQDARERRRARGERFRGFSPRVRARLVFARLSLERDEGSLALVALSSLRSVSVVDALGGDARLGHHARRRRRAAASFSRRAAGVAARPPRRSPARAARPEDTAMSFFICASSCSSSAMQNFADAHGASAVCESMGTRCADIHCRNRSAFFFCAESSAPLLAFFLRSSMVCFARGRYAPRISPRRVQYAAISITPPAEGAGGSTDVPAPSRRARALRPLALELRAPRRRAPSPPPSA